MTEQLMAQNLWSAMIEKPFFKPTALVFFPLESFSSSGFVRK